MQVMKKTHPKKLVLSAVKANMCAQFVKILYIRKKL